MPDRIIRDEALKSDALLGLKRNTHRLAFIACVLEADDLGNFEAGPGALWRLWRDWLTLTDRAQVAEIMSALCDADLVRMYDVDNKRYAHVPKFRQRLRYINGKHPRPPDPVECKEIKELVREKSAHGPTKVGPVTVYSQTAVDRSEVKRSEVKRRDARETRRAPRVPIPVGFGISDRVRAWAAAKGHFLLDQRLEHFVSQARAKGYTYVDWDEAFMNAIRKDWAGLAGAGKPNRVAL